MATARLPIIIAALTWDRHGRPPAKERLLVAKRDGDAYVVDGPPAPVTDRRRLIPGFAEEGGRVLLGIDAPLGLPAAWAERVEIESFRLGLARFGEADGWTRFYEATDDPTLRQPFAPADPRSKLSRIDLARALGYEHDSELFRECERGSTHRNSPEIAFFVKYVARNGRSAIGAWRDVLAPALDQVAIWPFDGELAAHDGVVVAEVLPWEALVHVGLDPRHGELPDWPGLAEHLATNGISHTGWKPHTKAHFDALAVVNSMVAVVRGTRPAFRPAGESLEGWILGMDPADLRRRPTKASVLLPTPPAADEVRYSIEVVHLFPDGGTVELARPSAGGGAINVLCGINNAGKSYLLDQLHRVLKGKSHPKTIAVEPLPRGQPRVLFLGQTWTDKDQIEVINLDISQRKLDLRGRHGDYRRAGLAMLLSQMSGYLGLGSAAEVAARVVEEEVRTAIAATFEVGAKIYRCNPEDPLVQQIEQIIGASLYFRCLRRDVRSGAWDFEFVLMYEDHATYPYEMWSEGQKSCFYVLTSLHYFQPEVLLFDEVENHLHPAYMSSVLEALHHQPVQAIVATHHPHLIFSRFVDRVFYVETNRPGPHRYPPQVADYSSEHDHRGFARKLIPLRDDFERVSNAYRLFTDQDDQMLRQASYIRSQATLTMMAALSKLFSRRPADSTDQSLPDTQSQLLADRIAEIASVEGLSKVMILDIGAGIGRQVQEIGKLSHWQIGAHVRWTCYEPFAEPRAQLAKTFEDNPDVAVAGSPEEFAGQKFQLVAMANVIHELHPADFAKMLGLAARHVRRPGGAVVFLELHPLLHPEGFAVPYLPADLTSLLARCGWSATHGTSSLRSRPVTAYYVIARPPAEPPSPEAMQAVIERTWDKILDRTLASLEMRKSSRNMAGYAGTLSELTTIASITAWRAGRWPAS